MPAWLKFFCFFKVNGILTRDLPRTSVSVAVGIKATTLFGRLAFVRWICVDAIYRCRWTPISHLICLDVYYFRLSGCNFVRT